MNSPVIHFSLFFCLSCFLYGVCVALPEEKFAPLPCWLVKGSRVHVCSETLETGARPRDDDDDDDDDDTAVGNLEIKKRLSDFLKTFLAKSEKHTPFWYRESPVSGGWFRTAIKKAMADVEISSADKRKFDSIAYNHRMGFGR